MFHWTGWKCIRVNCQWGDFWGHLFTAASLQVTGLHNKVLQHTHLNLILNSKNHICLTIDGNWWSEKRLMSRYQWITYVFSDEWACAEDRNNYFAGTGHNTAWAPDRCIMGKMPLNQPCSELCQLFCFRFAGIFTALPKVLLLRKAMWEILVQSSGHSSHNGNRMLSSFILRYVRACLTCIFNKYARQIHTVFTFTFCKN